MRESQKKLLTPELALEDVLKAKKEKYKALPWLIGCLPICCICMGMFMFPALAVILLVISVIGTPIAILIQSKNLEKLEKMTQSQLVIEEDECCDKQVVPDSEGPDDHYLYFKKAGKVYVNGFGIGDLSYDGTNVGDHFYTVKLQDEKKPVKFYPAAFYRTRELTAEELAQEAEDVAAEHVIHEKLVQEISALESEPELNVRIKKAKAFKQDEYMVPVDKPRDSLNLTELLARDRFENDMVAAMEYMLCYCDSDQMDRVVEAFDSHEAAMCLKVMRYAHPKRRKK